MTGLPGSVLVARETCELSIVTTSLFNTIPTSKQTYSVGEFHDICIVLSITYLVHNTLEL